VKTSILLITLSGKDRPGIVQQIEALAHQHLGNWERSRLIHLNERFVGLVQISVPEENVDLLKNALHSIEGLDLTIAEGSEPAAQASSEHRIALVGADHPGIVSEIFAAIAALGLNVESLSTRTEAAADSGTTLFRAEARLSSPDPIHSDLIREKLESLAHDLLVEVSISSPEG